MGTPLLNARRFLDVLVAGRYIRVFRLWNWNNLALTGSMGASALLRQSTIHTSSKQGREGKHKPWH